MQDPSPTDFLQQPQSPHSQLTLLGGFELSCQGWPEHLPAAAERLVAYLAPHERQMSRSLVAGTLWPGYARSQQGGTSAPACGDFAASLLALINVTSSHLGLSGDMVVDVHELVILAQSILHGGREYTDDEIAILLKAEHPLPKWNGMARPRSIDAGVPGAPGGSRREESRATAYGPQA
jgi:hypothetical protein